MTITNNHGFVWCQPHASTLTFTTCSTNSPQLDSFLRGQSRHRKVSTEICDTGLQSTADLIVLGDGKVEEIRSQRIIYFDRVVRRRS